MIIKTKHFGEMEVEDNRIIEFPEGIPGFGNIKKYILIFKTDENTDFGWMQSIDDSSVSFVVADPFFIRQDYDFTLEEDILSLLGIERIEDVLVFGVVNVPADVRKASINLRAPIIINKNTRKGKQVVLDTDTYGVRHYIEQELKKQGAIVNACANEKKRAVVNT